MGANAADAAEYGTGSWLKGYTDIFGGIVPSQPGLYVRDDAYPLSGRRRHDRIQWSCSNWRRREIPRRYPRADLRDSITDGQIVKKGDLLFVIEPRPYELALETAKAQLAQANSQLDLVKSQLERTAQLRRNDYATQETYD